MGSAVNSIFSNVDRRTNPVPVHCGRSRYNSVHSAWYRDDVQGSSMQPMSVAKRIVGGQMSQSGEWPWLVTLQLLRNNSYYEHLCGGSLIAPQWIVTGAHCFESIWAEFLTDKPSAWKVRVGEHNLFEEDESQVEFNVVKIIRYPDREPRKSFKYDIALVKLSAPADLNERVNLICLPAPREKFATGTKCLTAGWGHIVEGGVVSSVVNHVIVPIISRKSCNDMYRKVYKEVKLTISEDMQCAGWLDGGRDACQYDSGGPLIYYNRADQRWILAGVVSTGYGCARPGFPGVYTKVSEFVPWIQDTIARN